MSRRFIAAYFPENSLVLRDGTKTEHPERLMLGDYDYKLGDGDVKLVVEGEEDFNVLLNELQIGYTITKKAGQEMQNE
jgi:hypothetical protein